MKIKISDEIVDINSSLGEGGEGEVFAINAEYCAKILHPELRTPESEAKICQIANLFESKSTALVTYPVDLVYEAKSSSDEAWLGYVMKSLRPHSSLKDISFSAEDTEIRNRDSGEPCFPMTLFVRMCIQSFAILEGLHSMKIVVGDLNNGNIVIEHDPPSVVFIDADSFQLEGEPCRVGIDEFLDPYLQATAKDMDGKYIFSPLSDIYALAYCWFLAFYGATPYDGRCVIDNKPVSKQRRRIANLTALRDWKTGNSSSTGHPIIQDDANICARTNELARVCPELAQFFADIFANGLRRSLVHYFSPQNDWQRFIQTVLNPFLTSRTEERQHAQKTFRDYQIQDDPSLLSKFCGQYGLNL